MKYRRIWLVMLGIIAIGVFVTTCNSFILNRRSAASAAANESVMDEAAPDDPSEEDKPDAGSAMARAADESIPKEETPVGQSAGGAAETAAANPMDEAAETDLEGNQVLSPLETADPTALVEAEAEERPGADGPGAAGAAGPGAAGPGAAQKNFSIVEESSGITDYRARLDELDLQIQKMRSAETEATTYSMKTAAENELKLWDSELNNIYNDILKLLDENQAEKLVTAEREWMKTRDARAVEAARKSAGGTLEGLEYTASLAESTRQRAYELADMYEQVAR